VGPQLVRQSVADAHVVLVAGPELPGAVAEVHSLQGLHEQPTLLVPSASRVDAVNRALDGAGLAHLACHGYVRADNPTFSSLLLSDGQLPVYELDQLGVAPYRMVLAACESGSDVIYEGNETLGFVSTLVAGVRPGSSPAPWSCPTGMWSRSCACCTRVRGGPPRPRTR
jgi:CHAT domain-containing protein